MIVAITDILLNWPNGMDQSVFMDSHSAAIQACISTGFTGLMSIPYNYYQNFWHLAGGTYPNEIETRSMGINYYTMNFEPDGV
jgi:hypothetical protein